jgi:hypothetical protein
VAPPDGTSGPFAGDVDAFSPLPRIHSTRPSAHVVDVDAVNSAILVRGYGLGGLGELGELALSLGAVRAAMAG